VSDRIVVVGAGPHALAVLAALADRPEPWPSSVTVVDPHSGWATAWDEKLERLQLDRLRSPQVHHPGPRPMALRDLVEAQPEAQQLLLRRPENERVPTPAGMRGLINQVAAGLGPIEWIHERAMGVALVDEARADAPGADPPPVRVALESGRVLHAGRLVLAHNPSFPRLPDWAGPLIEHGIARHSSLVDLRDERLGGRHVAIVGGGLTAGTLALAVARAGGLATLLTRRPLRARPYDVDASWLGPRRLREFMEGDGGERRALVDVARDGGTMPEGALEALRELARTPGGGLVLREAVDVEGELRELLGDEFSAAEDDGELAADGLGDDMSAVATTAAPVSAVWLATGFGNHVLEDPLTGPVVRQLGTPIHDGLPEVDEYLRLPGSPIFMAGPFAALGVGPASRNLSGARPAAARIAAGLLS
jgi:hypothetical protein